MVEMKKSVTVCTAPAAAGPGRVCSGLLGAAQGFLHGVGHVLGGEAEVLEQHRRRGPGWIVAHGQ